ncbi:hypothetical protein P7C70_g9286, partial [Phenoliferia sp. Uapishka_3]
GEWRRGSRSNSSPIPPGYSNRHLFVGNLPFNCQWQELKDLMRSAGSVLRADIAQGPDGRSRGFGSVLFSTPQDADRAVQMFNGSVASSHLIILPLARYDADQILPLARYDYNGRALKVHFDKFAHSPSSQNSPSMYSMQPPHSYHVPSHPYDDGHRDHHMPMPFPPDLHRHGHTSSSQHHPPPNALLHRSDESHSSSSSSLDTSAPSTSDPQNSESADEGADSKASPKPHAEPPGRITMPPPYPFNGPLSPMNGMNGRLPPMTPMTPSMPAFTLGAFPQTPPVYPMLFSPGLGPFSPMGPHFNHGGHFMNVAPGAPIYSQGEGMFGAYNGATNGEQEGYSEKTPPASQVASTEPSYFPPVPVDSAAAQSTNSSSATSGPPFPASSPLESYSANPSRSTTPIALTLEQLKITIPVRAVSPVLEVGWADEPEEKEVPAPTQIKTQAEVVRRKSLIAAGTVDTGRALGTLNIRKRFEGESDRRASFDTSRPKPVFGTSIWATDNAVE